MEAGNDTSGQVSGPRWGAVIMVVQASMPLRVQRMTRVM